MINIKPANTTEDLAIIQQLIHKIWKPTYKAILSEAQMDYMLATMYNLQTLEEQVKQGQQFLILDYNKESIGFAAFEFNFEIPGTTKLHKIYMLPVQQGNGLGKILLNHIITTTKEAGQKKLVLNVNRENTALNFYKHIGFSISEIVDIPIGEGYYMNDYIMMLDL